jgi:hypothetical protein
MQGSLFGLSQTRLDLESFHVRVGICSLKSVRVTEPRNATVMRFLFVDEIYHKLESLFSSSNTWLWRKQRMLRHQVKRTGDE